MFLFTRGLAHCLDLLVLLPLSRNLSWPLRNLLASLRYLGALAIFQRQQDKLWTSLHRPGNVLTLLRHTDDQLMLLRCPDIIALSDWPFSAVALARRHPDALAPYMTS